MPFAEFSHAAGFQAPQAPDWTRFAEKAIDLQANRPIVNTAAIVDKAVEQINGILKMASPEERAKRDLQRIQIDTLRGVYQDYKAHPEKYQMTAHGPVLIDPYERASKIANIRHTVASTNFLNKKIQGGGTPSFISQALPKMQAAIQAEKQGVSLAPSKMANVKAVENQAAQADPNESSDDDAATNEALTIPAEGSYSPDQDNDQ